MRHAPFRLFDAAPATWPTSVSGLPRLCLTVLLAALPAASAGAQGPPAPQLVGAVTGRWGDAETAPCVRDVTQSLRDLSARGFLLAYWLNGAPDVSPLRWHWQGIQRLTAHGARFLAISRAGSSVGVVIVEMGSREKLGFGFGSNRISAGRDPGAVEPPQEDRVVLTISHQPGFHHAGGMQAVGNVLAVPYENKSTSQSRVVFYDVGDPENTRELNVFDRSQDPQPPEPGNASAVGLVKLADGRYLMVLGVHSSKRLEFYVSTTTSLFDPALSFRLFHTQRGGVRRSFQNMALVTQCDGRIYLVGTYNTALPPPSKGGDRIEWYQLANGMRASVVMLPAGRRKMVCDRCNFGAGAGFYIDPLSRLYLYGIEHDNDAPGGTVGVEEFRHRPAAQETP